MKGPINTLAAVVPKANAPAAATAAVITLAAEATTRHVVTKVFGGYSATPTGGSLTIVATVLGTAVTMVVPVVAAGPFEFDFSPPLQGDLNTAITITLASGAEAVVGSINALTQ